MTMCDFFLVHQRRLQFINRYSAFCRLELVQESQNLKYQFEGSRPEWCISSMIYSRDTQSGREPCCKTKAILSTYRLGGFVVRRRLPRDGVSRWCFTPSERVRSRQSDPLRERKVRGSILSLPGSICPFHEDGM